MCDQRACRVSPMRVPWQSIIRANMASSGAGTMTAASCSSSPDSCTPRSRDGLIPTLAFEKSLNLMVAIGLAEISPSLNAWRKARASSWNTERT
ncbi:hypothetical protein D3C71_1759920 [compost metagenome]